MASIKLSIHVPPDANPQNVGALVTKLSADPKLHFQTPSELLEYLVEEGVGSRSEITSIASGMSILRKSEEGIYLSTDGLALSQVRDDALHDLLHFKMYSGWTAENPTEFLQSWAYRTACNQYWELDTVELGGEYLDRQVAELISLAQSTFSDMNVGTFDEVSFSRKSIRGIHNWLEAVSPAVIEDKQFRRRSFCPPELVVMAISHVLHQEDNILGVDILLTPEKRELISKICLLEPDALDRILDWAMSIFPNLIVPGTAAGFYGRFIRLNRLPSLQDVVR